MKRVGFTLIELLVVIAVIAILMGILMPALKLVRDQAKRVNCVANVRTLSLAWLQYANNNDDVMVGGNMPASANFKNAAETLWVQPPQNERTKQMAEYFAGGSWSPSHHGSQDLKLMQMHYALKPASK